MPERPGVARACHVGECLLWRPRRRSDCDPRDHSRCSCFRRLHRAHPGYPDRAGFGRREQKLTTFDVVDLIRIQIKELMSLAAEVRAKVSYLKPHGALYNQAGRDSEVARGVVAAASEFGLPLVGQPGSVLASVASKCGVVYVAEGFPDRRYRERRLAHAQKRGERGSA